MWRKVDNYLFAQTSAINLGVGRAFFFLCWSVYYFNYESSSFVDPRYNFVQQPISFYRLIPPDTLSPGTVHVLTHIWFWLIIFATLGFFTRFSVMGVGILGTYLIGLPYNFGKVVHSNTLPLMVALILGLSHCGDAFSVDAFLKRLVRKFRGHPVGHWKTEIIGAQRLSGEYLWPIRLIRVYICWVYFSAAYQKLAASGLKWVFSSHMQNILRFAQMPFGLLIADYRPLTIALAGWTLVMQACAPLALLSDKIATIVVPELMLLHVGALFTMGHLADFTAFEFAYIFWVPWDKIIGRATQSAFLRGIVSRSRYQISNLFL